MHVQHGLDLSSLRSKAQTISVYTRHAPDCSKKHDPHWKRCNCVKYIYLLKDGKIKTISAKTRSWANAEQKAQEIRDSWDPVKQRLKELDDLKARDLKAKELEAMTIEAALDRWVATIRSKHENNATMSKYTTIAKQIKSWSTSKGLSKAQDLSPDNLDEWKCSGGPGRNFLR